MAEKGGEPNIPLEDSCSKFMYRLSLYLQQETETRWGHSSRTSMVGACCDLILLILYLWGCKKGLFLGSTSLQLLLIIVLISTYMMCCVHQLMYLRIKYLHRPRVGWLGIYWLPVVFSVWMICYNPAMWKEALCLFAIAGVHDVLCHIEWYAVQFLTEQEKRDRIARLDVNLNDKQIVKMGDVFMAMIVIGFLGSLGFLLYLSVLFNSDASECKVSMIEVILNIGASIYALVVVIKFRANYVESVCKRMSFRYTFLLPMGLIAILGYADYILGGTWEFPCCVGIYFSCCWMINAFYYQYICSRSEYK